MSTISTTTVWDYPEIVVQPDRPTTEPILEDIDLVEKMHIIPTFKDKNAERSWAKEHMAGAFRIFAKLGYNDEAGGHISLRDPVHSDCFWISKFKPL